MPLRLSATHETNQCILPLRQEVKKEFTWDLTALFKTEEAWEEEFKNLSRLYCEITRFQGKVGSSAKDLLELLEFQKKLHQSLELLSHYAGLCVAEDGSNHISLDREGRLQALATNLETTSSFIAPEIQAIEDQIFSDFLADPVLQPWSIPLQRLRRLHSHTLSDREERLMALSHPSIAGHEEIFSQLTNVDMIFGSIQDHEGSEVILTQSSFSSLLQHTDRKIRQDAFTKFYKEFSEHRFTLAATLSSSIKGDVFYARARNYSSAIEAALFEDNVPLSLYDQLIKAVCSHSDVLSHYYDLRRRVLQVPELHIYDTYVPLVTTMQSHVSFDEAIDTILASLEPLGSEYVTTLAKGLREDRWCDRYENKGKRSGAFSCGAYEGPPYILMNYKADVFSDVYTLAHEAGHSMHTWYARNNQEFQNYNYPIFLAEVASTFNEVLLTEYLLASTKEPMMRAYILNRQIDDLRSTLFRQTMFAEFEKITHTAEESGEALTLDFFTKTYRSLLDCYLSPGVFIDDLLELECLRIPHFYNAFYVYQYATGIAAAVTLANEVLTTGNSSRYLEFLKSGNSQFPIETLLRAGVDMTSAEPIEITLNLFERRVRELEELLIGKHAE